MCLHEYVSLSLLPIISLLFVLQIDSTRVQLADRDISRDREIVQLKAQLKEAHAQMGDISKAMQRRVKELEDLREELTNQISSVEKRREDDVNMYRRRSEECEQKLREIEGASSSESRRSKYVVDQLKEKYSAAVQQFESKMEEERGATKRLANANR